MRFAHVVIFESDMKPLAALLMLLVFLAPQTARSQTGHVVNDIKILFVKYHELKSNIWSLKSDLNKLVSGMSSDSSLVDTFTKSMLQLTRKQHVADSALMATLAGRVEALEAGTALDEKSTASMDLSSLPLILLASTLLLSLAALVIVLFRRPTRVREVFLPAPGAVTTESPPHDDATEEELPVRPTSRTHSKEPHQHIPIQTLSKRSEIMRQFGMVTSKSSTKDTLQAERKRVLTDRASELLLLANRSNISDRERERAEQEIADILREMMELR